MRVCARAFVLSVFLHACVLTRACVTPVVVVARSLESSLTPEQSQTHLHWNGRVAGPLYGLFAFALMKSLNSTSSLALTHKCTHAYKHMYAHMQSHTDTWEFTRLQVTQLFFPNCWTVISSVCMCLCGGLSFEGWDGLLDGVCSWGHVVVNLFSTLTPQLFYLRNDCWPELI